MKNFKVYENVLNEYVNHPNVVLVQEVEAETEEEAVRLVRMMYPNKASLTVNGKNFEV